METTIIGLFSDSEHAGMAVGEFKNMGYADNITVISRKGESDDVDTHEVTKDVSEGTASGAMAGAAVGGLAGLLTGVASFLVPGLGLVVLGPLASVLTGLGAGALTGGLVGALVDWGLPDATAREYEERLKAGDVLVAVTAAEDKAEEIQDVMDKHGVDETQTVHAK